MLSFFASENRVYRWVIKGHKQIIIVRRKGSSHNIGSMLDGSSHILFLSQGYVFIIAYNYNKIISHNSSLY